MTDERDLRDPALDAAWRAQSTETPPPALDAAILAAAHRAVKSAPEKIGPGREATRPWRWWTPLAAAAVIGVIAIGALQLLPQEPDPTKVVVSDTPPFVAKRSTPAATTAAPPPVTNAVPAQVAPPAAPAPSMASPAPARNALRSRAESAPKPAESGTALQDAPSRDAVSREEKVTAAPPAPEPFPARRDAVEARKSSAPEAREKDEPSPAPSPRMAQSPAPSAAAGALAAPALSKRAASDAAAPQRAPDDFVARIRKLFVDGNMAEAQRELAAFRAAYPDADARLPADLRPWAATIPRAS